MDQTHLSEDTVSQSGWVFADLLVALSVIFLATISFVPANQSQSASFEIEPGKLARADGFSKLYKEISVPLLLSDLSDFRNSKSIGRSVEIIHIQFIGSQSNEGGRSGILDALRFSIELQNASLPELSDVSISLDTSDKLSQGEVIVRAVFGVRQNP